MLQIFRSLPLSWFCLERSPRPDPVHPKEARKGLGDRTWTRTRFLIFKDALRSPASWKSSAWPPGC